MPGFLPNTNCMVAALCAWHVYHARAQAEIDRRLARGERMLVAAPALVEAYAVLTRLPPPHRIARGDACSLLETNFLRGARLIALDGRGSRALLREAPQAGVAGGRTSDAVIAACALTSRGTVLVTFNPGDFVPFGRRGWRVFVPGGP